MSEERLGMTDEQWAVFQTLTQGYGDQIDWWCGNALAWVIHVTDDLDVCYTRNSQNLQALAAALFRFYPTLRDAPVDVPFVWDARTLQSVQNLTLQTDMGPVDLLAEPPGAPVFSALWERAVVMKVHRLTVRVASLDDLISMKRAAARPKDQLHLLELESLRILTAQESAAKEGISE